MKTAFICVRTQTSGGLLKNDNKPPGFITDGIFLDQLKDY
jgi:hypothetical protein